LTDPTPEVDVPEFLGSWEFIVLALLVLVLFGAKRLPDSARALGRSMRIFKAETKGLRSDDDTVIAPTGISTGDTAMPTTGTPGTMPVPPVPPAVEQQQQQRPPQQ
jgi:sec-independent protein translocase protein TatA